MRRADSPAEKGLSSPHAALLSKWAAVVSRVRDRCLRAQHSPWRPLSGGVVIGAEVGRMSSRDGESRVPKYGRFLPRLG